MNVQVINDDSCISIITEGVPLHIHKVQVKTVDTVKNDTVRIDIGEGALRHIYIKFEDVTVPAGLADVNALRDAIKAMLDTGQGGNTNALGASIDSVKGSVDALKGNVDAVTQAIANTSMSEVNNIYSVKQSVDGLGSQINSVKQSVDSLGQLITNISPIQGLQNVHDQIAATGQSQTTQLTNMAVVLGDIKSLLNGSSDSFKEPARVDESVPNVVYKGYVASGSHSGNASADPIWAIQRITSKQDIITYEWAGGNKQFINMWDSRYNLPYMSLGQ
jgi:archaellum component FlaC